MLKYFDAGRGSTCGEAMTSDTFGTTVPSVGQSAGWEIPIERCRFKPGDVLP